MTIDAALRALLLQNTDIKSRVADRVRPVVLSASDEGDAILYLLEDDTRVVTQDGATQQDDGDVKWRLAIRSRDYYRMRELRELVVTHLNTLDVENSNGFDFTIFYDEDTDSSVYEDDGEEQPVYQQNADFSVMYRSTP